MKVASYFSQALPLKDFLAKYGTGTDRTRWEAALAATTITDEQKQLLGKFKREMNVLVLAGAWCGDCVSQCPVFERFAEAAPVIKVRYLDRDENVEVQDELEINGGKRVPIAVFISEDGFEVSRYGERTLAKYRQMVNQLSGEACASGLVSKNDPVQIQTAQEWLNEFERSQWMLRLSPRLRRKHGD